MKRERDATWYEMFGADELEPLQKEAPALPMDDPFFLEHVTGGRSAERIQDQEFIKEISGHDPALSPLPPKDQLGAFVKRATARLQEIEKHSPRRRTEIRKMLRKFADRLPGKHGEEFDAAFDRLSESCLRFVTQACLTEA